MRFKEFYMLHEMVERIHENGGNTIIAHNGNIWRISDDPDEQTINDISNLTGIEDPTDLSEFEERPDVFFGNIRNNYLYANDSQTKFSTTSPLIKKLIKHYELDGYYIPNTYGDGEETYISPYELTGDYPNHAYHGTSSTYTAEILSKGIMPVEHSNWEK